MTIGHIFAGDVESEDKINRTIDKANLVDEKAGRVALEEEISARQHAVSGLQKQIADETSARQHAVTGLQKKIGDETSARQKAIAAEADARSKQVAALQGADNDRPRFAQAVVPPRPGEEIRYFTAMIDGEPADLTPLSDDEVGISASGKVAVLAGAKRVAPIGAWRVEPGCVYRVRFVVQRAVDTEDPANDAVRLALRWLDAKKSGVSTTICADLVDIVRNSGRVEYTVVFARVDGGDIDLTAPAAAVYVRPFVQAFGSGVTHVEVIEIADLTMAVAWSPDVSTFRNEVAGLEQRLADLGETNDELRAMSGINNWVTVPASRTSKGIAGQKAYNNTHLYICIAPDTWRRVPLSTW